MGPTCARARIIFGRVFAHSLIDGRFEFLFREYIRSEQIRPLGNIEIVIDDLMDLRQDGYNWFTFMFPV